MSEIRVGDRVKASQRTGVGVVMAADNGWAWVRWPEEPCPLTQNTTSLTLIPPKIAEPPVGSSVWDGGTVWTRDKAGWHGRHGGRWTYRHLWADFSDDVTLAVDPKAASHD